MNHFESLTKLVNLLLLSSIADNSNSIKIDNSPITMDTVKASTKVTIGVNWLNKDNSKTFQRLMKLLCIWIRERRRKGKNIFTKFPWIINSVGKGKKTEDKNDTQQRMNNFQVKNIQDNLKIHVFTKLSFVAFTSLYRLFIPNYI